MKIVQLLPTLSSGGVERGVLDLSAFLEKKGHTSIVISSGGPLVDQLKGRHITLPSLKSKNPLLFLKQIYDVQNILDDVKPDIVHVRSRHPAWILKGIRNRSFRIISTFHGFYGHRTALKRAYNRIMLNADVVIVASSFIQKHVASVYGVSNTVLIPRGVDLDLFTPSPSSTQEPTFLFPGRISPWKGQKIFLSALSELSERPWRAIIVGKGDTQALRSYWKGVSGYDRSMYDRLEILDATSDISFLYQMCDVVVSGSLKGEAFGRVVVEAQAMQRPVIATAIGGTLETAHDKRWLVPPGDVAALRKALNSFLDLYETSPGTLIEMGMNGRAHVQKHFSLESMCAKTLSVYTMDTSTLVERPL